MSNTEHVVLSLLLLGENSIKRDDGESCREDYTNKRSDWEESIAGTLFVPIPVHSMAFTSSHLKLSGLGIQKAESLLSNQAYSVCRTRLIPVSVHQLWSKRGAFLGPTMFFSVSLSPTAIWDPYFFSARCEA